MSGVTPVSTVGGKQGPSASPPASTSAPFATRVLDQPGDPLDRGLVDERPDLRVGLARVADRQRARRSASFWANASATARSATIRSVDMQIWPWWKNAPKLAAATARVEVGVPQHDDRRLAAELEQHALEVAAGLLGDDPADLGRPGEVDPPGGRVGDQLVDDVGGVGRVVGDQVDDARRAAPASWSARDDRGVRARALSDALSTTVLAYASGVATARVARITGAFQGAIATTTPAGARTPIASLPGHVGGDHLADEPRRPGRPPRAASRRRAGS